MQASDSTPSLLPVMTLEYPPRPPRPIRACQTPAAHNPTSTNTTEANWQGLPAKSLTAGTIEGRYGPNQPLPPTCVRFPDKYMCPTDEPPPGQEWTTPGRWYPGGL